MMFSMCVFVFLCVNSVQGIYNNPPEPAVSPSSQSRQLPPSPVEAPPIPPRVTTPQGPSTNVGVVYV